MSLPDEKFRSIQYSREFMRDLLDPKKTPRVPKEIRKRAYSCLRHFPYEFDISIAGYIKKKNK
jgi:hypothetical protein